MHSQNLSVEEFRKSINADHYSSEDIMDTTVLPIKTVQLQLFLLKPDNNKAVLISDF